MPQPTSSTTKPSKSFTWPAVQDRHHCQQSDFALHDDHAVYLSLTTGSGTKSGEREKSWIQRGMEVGNDFIFCIDYSAFGVYVITQGGGHRLSFLITYFPLFKSGPSYSLLPSVFLFHTCDSNCTSKEYFGRANKLGPRSTSTYPRTRPCGVLADQPLRTWPWGFRCSREAERNKIAQGLAQNNYQ